MVWSATSRCETVADEAMFHSQGRSSGQTPLSSSKRAMVETRRADAVRACELRVWEDAVQASQHSTGARPRHPPPRHMKYDHNALGLCEEEVEQAGFEGSADLLRLGEPLLVLLRGDTLAELDEGELPDLRATNGRR